MKAPPGKSEPRSSAVISLYLKVPYTVFVLVLVPVYWVEYGPANFLWGSDIALLVTLLALWTESRLLVSMMAIGVLVPELAWTIDFIFRLVSGPDSMPLRGTRYMFDTAIPVWVRGLSLFHVALPVILVWLLYRLRYQRSALVWQMFLAWLVLPISYLVGEESANINWVHGFGQEPQTWMPGPLYVALLMVLFPLCFYLPAHLFLSRLFPDARHE